MEENLTQVSESISEEVNEPVVTDNSQTSASQSNQQEQTLIKEGQSNNDPSEKLILGKFKTVEDLEKAYSELQKYQGKNSEELGALRKEVNSIQDLSQTLQKVWETKENMVAYLKEYKEKYDQPEYFQDNSFCNIYNEAFKLLGEKLDTDKFVELLNGYVQSRINAYEKTKSANLETERILDSMSYNKNPKSSLMPPHKSFDEMSDKEIDEMLEKVI